MTGQRPYISSTMEALRMHRRGGPDQLVYEKAPAPTAGTGDVLVEVQAASYTPGELDWPSTWIDRAGRERWPVIPSHEVSGIVAAVGFGEVRLSVGDEVYGLTDWYRDGAAAELVAVEARNLALKPASITHLEACTIPLAGLTALQGLLEHGQLQRGQTTLIVGAAGGVGALAVQLARAEGARVIAAARAAEEEMVMRLGADSFIDVEGTIAEMASRVSLVFDTIGGNALRKASRAVAPGGSIVSIVEQPPCGHAPARRSFFVVEPDRAGLDNLSRCIDTGILAPALGARSTLAQAAETIALKHAGSIHGKIAIDVTGRSATRTFEQYSDPTSGVWKQAETAERS